MQQEKQQSTAANRKEIRKFSGFEHKIPYANTRQKMNWNIKSNGERAKVKARKEEKKTDETKKTKNWNEMRNVSFF